jgi:hypothetical protein
MPTAESVRPQKWQNQTVLFDNGWYSVIAGIYDGRDGHSVLGERWNGSEGELGFPNQSGYPTWHVIPHFLAIPVLEGLLDELAAHPSDKSDEFAEEIVKEIRVQHAIRCR